MTKRNPNFARLAASYLFPEINRRKNQFLEQHPHAALISLGIGDTTEPISPTITHALALAAENLGTVKGYSGYGPEQGYQDLRSKIAEVIYKGRVTADEIFISDGAKCDIGRLQMLFGNQVSIALQNPVYPVYRDGSLIQGVEDIVCLPCTPENDFWPDWSHVKRTDLIYWCSPNNPTGTVTTRKQLKEIVSIAKANQSIIIFDSAYSHYIRDKTIPRSIFEIEGADEVALEISSFSKIAGFTGVRLGWSVVPNALKYQDSTSVKADWKRLTSTIFNGASNIAQHGGLAALSPEGMEEIEGMIDFYLENTALIKKTMQEIGYQVYGGDHAPYLWVKFPGKSSWDAFQELLEKVHLITTPGSGFGECGEGFLRMSAFGHRESILEAISRLKKWR